MPQGTCLLSPRDLERAGLFICARSTHSSEIALTLREVLAIFALVHNFPLQM